VDFLPEIKRVELSDAFGPADLVQSLNTSVASSRVFNVFLPARCLPDDKGFVSKAITVDNFIEQRGDAHHIFPRDCLEVE